MHVHVLTCFYIGDLLAVIIIKIKPIRVAKTIMYNVNARLILVTCMCVVCVCVCASKGGK